jgi:4-amino-4-deoxy-L-arabinose transferase-like glycosyltransferase
MRFLWRARGGDEGTFVDGAVRIVHGQVFARDFFEVMGPGTFYWVAIFFKLFGATFLAARICLFVTSLSTGLLMYFLSRRVCRRYYILPCIVLAGTSFGGIWPSVSHHVDSNCLALLSVTCVVLWQERRRDSLLFVAGILAGATACFLQTKGILLLLSLLLWLWIQRKKQPALVSALGLVIAGFCSVIGIVLVYFWHSGALWDLVYANFVWPSKHYGFMNVVPYAQDLIRYYWGRWQIAKSGISWTAAMAAFLMIPLFFVAALPALLPILGARFKWSIMRPEIVLYLLCGGALWLSELHRKDIAHLVFGSPLLIILCIHYLAEYRGKVADYTLKSLSVCAGCLAAFNLALILVAHPMATRVGSVEVFESDAALTFLDEQVAPGEKILSYPCSPMYYFLSNTTNPTPYSLLLYDYNSPSQFHDVIRILEQDKVKYVLWDTNFLAKDAPFVFPNMKSRQPSELIMEPYLESHYRLVKSEDGVRIMERKSEDHAAR